VFYLIGLGSPGLLLLNECESFGLTEFLLVS